MIIQIFILKKYEIFTCQNELNNVKFFDKYFLHTRIFFRKSPMRSIISLFYYYFEFLYNDFYVSISNIFNELLIFDSMFNYIEEDIDFVLYNYHKTIK